MDSILSKYLQDGSLESQGQFTISPKKALEKFGRHAFPRKTAWLTKLLQSLATGSPSPKMRVSLEPKSLRINLAGGWQGEADAATLMSEVLNLQEKGFGDPLVDGLRYVASSAPLSLDLLTVKNGEAKISRMSRESVENFQLEWTKRETFLEIQLSGETDLGSKAEMEEELVRAAGFLGFPVTLNGKALQGSLLRKGRSGYVPGPGGFLLSKLAIKPKAEQRAISGHVLKNRNQMDEAELCFNLRPSREPMLVLNWAVDGVVLKRQKATTEGSGELHLLLPFQKEQADLSGFDFTFSSREHHLLDRCTPLVTNLIWSDNGRTSSNSAGGRLAGSLSRYRAVLTPVVSAFWMLNYLVLLVAFIVFLIAVYDIASLGFQRSLRTIVFLLSLFIPTLFLWGLESMIMGSEPESDYPSAIVQPPPQQVSAVPLSQLDWR